MSNFTKKFQAGAQVLAEASVNAVLSFDPMSGINFKDGRPYLFQATLPDGRRLHISFAAKSIGGQLRDKLIAASAKGETVTIPITRKAIEVREVFDIGQDLVLGRGTATCVPE